MTGEDRSARRTNNASERALRAVAVGRKNYLFAGSDAGGRSAAVLYSVVGTCRRLGLDPFPYLRDAVARLPALPAARAAELLPDRWAAAAGETITLYNPEVAIAEPLLGQIGPEPLVTTPTIRVRPGRYTIAFGGMVHSHPTLSTGTTEFEVREPAKPAAATEEPFTAWGKEINGLQAGLSLPPGAKRAYAYGETVTLVVRVRNVGKETVIFEYVRQFLDENPPTVTGADGKAIPQGATTVTGLIHVPIEVTLEPGKEVVLESRFHGSSGWPYELRPAGGGGKPTTRESPLVVGTGKVGVQYGRVFGNSSAGDIKIDPALSKLATGKLEVEVTSDPPAASEKK